MSGYSLSWLKREIDELRRDRVALASALDIMKRRILESNELEIQRRPMLHEWSGTRAVVGSLELSLHSVERTIDEMASLILAIESGEVPDLDPPSKSDFRRDIGKN